MHRSPVILTPYSAAHHIDTSALRRFVDRSYAEAGWTRADVESGAVIATGEAARSDNAAAIVALFSDEAGKFVCATAGHHLEGLLAAHGSGAVARSRQPESALVLAVDIGGGTTKLAVCRSGRVEETAALDLGARLVSWGDGRRVRAITAAGRALVRSAGLAVAPGDVLDDATVAALADHLADLILRVPEGQVVDPGLWLTAPLLTAGPFPVVVLSGGVGEYIHGWHDEEHGDLGRALGRAIVRRSTGRGLPPPVEAIRATCIGASQYTVQVSGDTLFVTHPELLPLRDLAAVPITPALPDAAGIAREVRAGIERLDRTDGRFALAVRWSHGTAYAALGPLCAGIAEGTRDVLPGGAPLVVIVDADIAGIVGQSLRDEHGVRSPLVCVDQIALSDLDFIDVGGVLVERGVVPVVVKSLVFAER